MQVKLEIDHAVNVFLFQARSAFPMQVNELFALIPRRCLVSRSPIHEDLVRLAFDQAPCLECETRQGV